MYKFFYCLIFVSICNLISYSQNENLNSIKKVENLVYSMRYGWFEGAICTVTLEETKYDGQDVFYAKASAETVGLADKLYNIHDEYSSYFLKDDCLPLKAIRSIKEGRYRYYNEVTYNHEFQIVNSQKTGEHFFPDSLPKKVFDMVSAFYHARKFIFEKLRVGDYMTLNTFFGDEFYLLQVKYIGLKEIEIDAGKILCREFRPVVEPGRAFDTKDDVKIYISNDSNSVPIRAQVDLMIGSFKVDLKQYSGLKSDLTFKTNEN